MMKPQLLALQVELIQNELNQTKLIKKLETNQEKIKYFKERNV